MILGSGGDDPHATHAHAHAGKVRQRTQQGTEGNQEPAGNRGESFLFLFLIFNDML